MDYISAGFVSFLVIWTN